MCVRQLADRALPKAPDLKLIATLNLVMVARREDNYENDVCQLD